jgi:prepilin-type N-terminal cleavage/methylation domain-containing protein
MARRRIGRRPERDAGFTLLELLVALALVTVIAAFSVTAYFGRSEVTLESAVRLLVDDLRMAQTRATFFGSPIEVVFAPDGSGYELVEHEPGDSSSAIGPLVPPRRFGAGAVFEGIRVERVEVGAGGVDGRLEFDAKGSLLFGATIVLADRAETRTIVIEEETGRIRLPERSTAWDPIGR